MAIIDKQFYKGTDQYSDGDVEEQILEIVRAGKSLSDLSDEEITWPVYYHLTPLRENICNWYPFASGSKVLEIGAGCGAITGALCGKDLDICSVDLSLRRTQINYERHKDYENLRLIAGNLNDIVFPEPFDYILLIGVLEYAGRFTEGEDPYKTFLVNIRKLLKPEGKLLLAIENRLGLKYFAGAPEDHLGTPFSGLRGYKPDTGIRTFSKGELTDLLNRSGFKKTQFFYPYPDYKMPTEIFTDDTLATQYYGKPYQVFDRDQKTVFSETEVATVLTKDGSIAALANSFLVEACEKEKRNPEDTLYVKLNTGRREALRIGTRIIKTEKGKAVSKFALTKAAEEHIRKIAENENALMEKKQILQGEVAGSEIHYPFCSLPTLEDKLRMAADEKDRQGIIHIFESIRRLAETQPTETSYDTDSFTQWFGEERLHTGQTLCVQPGNVDLVTDNVFMDGDKPIIADCEWVADFPVPLFFIIWRSVENAYLKMPMLQETLVKEELLDILGIQEKEIPVFRHWSCHFENTYVSDRNYSSIAKEVLVVDFSPEEAAQWKQTILNQSGHIEQLMQSERDLNAKVAQQEQDKQEIREQFEQTILNQSGHIEQLLQSDRELNAKVAQQERDKQEMRDRISELEAELDIVYNSTSWRMTKIFRDIHDKMKAGKKQE